MHNGISYLRIGMIYLAISISTGSVVAFFLWGLDRITECHWQNPWLLYGLPIFGVISSVLYRRFGQRAEQGNALVFEEIQKPRQGVPAAMAPLVLIGTFLTHLGGGSAGREGTAVQMGGSLASVIARRFGIQTQQLSPFLNAGVAAGFGAVFGTPVAGAIFSLEVLSRGKLNFLATIPCLFCAILSDEVTTWWGIVHTPFAVPSFSNGAVAGSLSAATAYVLLLQVVLASCLFGMASCLFVRTTHCISSMAKHWISIDWLRPLAGGFVLIALALIFEGDAYLGLGVNSNPKALNSITISSCFVAGGATHFSWILKLLFTAFTVGTAFKGGEVTPLFFVGAALGNSIGVLLGAPVDLMAALGLLAVFASATKTPFASTVLGIELFASDTSGVWLIGFIVYTATSCFIASFISGKQTIYRRVQAEQGVQNGSKAN
jgi:H+/Cl- antiporter ClcA